MIQSTFDGHHEIVGEGIPVLVYNGFGCANWFFQDCAERLKDIAQFVLLENRGIGKADKALEPYDIEHLAQDGLDLMDHLGFDRFVVLGYSMGSFMAQVLALQAPERLRALVLLCSMGPGPDFLPLPVVTDDMLRDSYVMPPPVMIDANLRMTTHPSFLKSQPERFAWLKKQRLASLADLEQVVFQNQAVHRYLSQPRPLHEIQCPTLIMAGAQDRFVNAGNSKILAKVLPQSRLKLVDEADHLFFHEKPEPVVRELRAFLEELS